MYRILFYGDSNTYGYDPTGYFGGRYAADVRWPDVLAHRLEGIWEVFADGQNGRQIPRHTADFGRLKRAVHTYAPLDVFAVMLGTNDLFSMIPREGESNAERTGQRMEQMLAFVSQLPDVAGHKTKLLLIAPPKMTVTDDFFFGGIPADASGADGPSLSVVYRRIATKQGLLFADAAAFDLPLSHDGVHLSAEGHLALATHLEALLRQPENMVY